MGKTLVYKYLIILGLRFRHCSVSGLPHDGRGLPWVVPLQLFAGTVPPCTTHIEFRCGCQHKR